MISLEQFYYIWAVTAISMVGITSFLLRIFHIEESLSHNVWKVEALSIFAVVAIISFLFENGIERLRGTIWLIIWVCIFWASRKAR